LAVLLMLLAGGRVRAQDPGTPGRAAAHAVVTFSGVASQAGAHPAASQKRAIPHPRIPANLPVPAEFQRQTEAAALPLADASPPSAQLPPSPAPAAGFDALGDDNTKIPPDTMGAVGPNHLMVTLNSQVRIQTRAGAAVSTVTLESFWAATGATGVFSPRIVYDPYGARWIFTAASDFATAASSVLIGVSQSNDPTGAWNLYRFDADSGNLNWADYPMVGFNVNWVAVSVNMFANLDNAFQNPKIFVFKKADLYNGEVLPATTVFEDLSGAGAPFPATTYDAALTTLYMARVWNTNVDNISGFLRIARITGTADSPSYSGTQGLVETFNPWADTPPLENDFAPQLGTADKIQNGDSRLLSVVYRNGSIWTAHNAFLPFAAPTRTAAQWWQFDTAGTIQQFGRVEDGSGNTFYAYPSITVNSQNDALMGFSVFSATQYPAAGYAMRNGFDPSNVMRTPATLKAGETFYRKVLTGTKNRWGDYSASVVDPVNDLDFWTIQEYADSPQFAPPNYGRWGTWWGKFTPPIPVGSVSWEKRKGSDNTLLGGTTFTLGGASGPFSCYGAATNPITVIDNGANDADPDAGQIQVIDVCFASYTITETVPPSGWVLDTDVTRSITVSGPGEVNAVVGTQGANDAGITDESDFHNGLGSLSWESRKATDNTLQGGATFTVGGASGPFSCAGTSTNPVTVVDNGANDSDPDAGQIQLSNVCLLATAYTITETVAPAGWAVDTDATRVHLVNLANLNAVVGTQGSNDAGVTDEPDFHNRIGSLAWEKRKATDNLLQGGATFDVSPDPLDGVGTLVIVDNGANDADADAGQILINNVLVAAYTITETIAPAGWALDSDPTRAQTVNAANLNAVVGTQGSNDAGVTDESDFHNRIGSLAWEKRKATDNLLQGGATFDVSPDPLDGVGTLVIVDNGANDADADAGQILINNVLMAAYTITETAAPAGWALDADPTREQTVSSANLAAVVGTQGQNDAGTTDESDFHNRVSSLAWEKRKATDNSLQGGATFNVSPHPLTGVGTLVIVDNGANDSDTDAGQIVINNVLEAAYTITETVAPSGWALDSDATRAQTVNSGNLIAVVGTQDQDDPGTTDESDFHNRLGSLSWEKRKATDNTLLGGATFSVSGSTGPQACNGTVTNPLVVVDNGANDSDADAGQIQLNGVCIGSYTIAETVPPAGWALDTDATRVIAVSAGELNPVVGTQDQDDPGVTEESDFHNRLGSLAWEKRRATDNTLQGGATFNVSPDPLDGVGSLNIVDNDVHDSDPDAGQIVINNALLAAYTITETVAPAGWSLDFDATRAQTVSAGNLNAVVGTQGQDDPGTTDESDFHNRVSSLAWESRKATDNGLQGGATFSVSPDPLDGVGTLTVTDNDANDDDADAGQIVINNVLEAAYTITETVAPAGWALDTDVTRAITVSSGELNAVVGTQDQNDPGTTDESDFHNRIGSLAWEVRKATDNTLQGGVTFSVSPDPLDGVGTLTIVDNDATDADTDAGQIQINNARVAAYTITETVAPTGWALDADATRAITVSAGDLNPVIGTQGTNDAGVTDESDFHNRLGSLAWEKRKATDNTLQGGATFTVGGAAGPFACNGIGNNPSTVVDNGANDSDADAGQILVNDVCVGAYTITETVAPSGWALDADPTREITVSAGALNPVVGTQGSNDAGSTDESDFHNRLGSLSWEKRRATDNVLQGGATFEVSPDPLDGVGTLVVVDNGANDANPAAGQIQVNNVLLASYTITETAAPAGWALDPDPTRAQAVTSFDLDAVVGAQGVNNPGATDESDFHNPAAAGKARRQVISD
jgi:uncharacterized surface anchored protein